MQEKLEVRRGVPFQIHPNLDTVQQVYLNGDLMESIPIELRSIGVGKISINRDVDLIRYPDKHQFTLGGPIRGEYLLKDGEVEVVRESAPLTVDATIKGLTSSVAERLRFDLIFAEQKFSYYPEIEDGTDGYSAFFYRHLNPLTNNPAIFDRIKFVFRTENPLRRSS